jgi:four helix bundle protein
MLTHRTLLAWQRARSLVVLVAAVQREHWRPWARAFWDQLQRASVSAQINIAEGYCGLSRRRWLYFLTIAHGSAVESLELTELLRDLEAVPSHKAAELVAAAEESVRLLHGLLKRARTQLRTP